MSKQMKVVEMRLFFNLSNRGYYVQIGEKVLFCVKTTVCLSLQDKYGLDIIHADDTKHMQTICNENKNG